MAQVSRGTMIGLGRPPLGVTGGRNFVGPRLNSRIGRSVFWGNPFFYPDEASAPLASETPSESVVVARPVVSEHTIEPLLIEWKGDRFVRTGSGANERDVDYSASPMSLLSSVTAIKDLAPVTLVYRDGQQRQVSDYVISNGAMYARSDYLHTGVWTETIKLSALDLPATVRLNEQNGLNFVFPSGPNEVVTRP